MQNEIDGNTSRKCIFKNKRFCRIAVIGLGAFFFSILFPLVVFSQSSSDQVNKGQKQSSEGGEKSTDQRTSYEKFSKEVQKKLDELARKMSRWHKHSSEHAEVHGKLKKLQKKLDAMKVKENRPDEKIKKLQKKVDRLRKKKRDLASNDVSYPKALREELMKKTGLNSSELDELILPKLSDKAREAFSDALQDAKLAGLKNKLDHIGKYIFLYKRVHSSDAFPPVDGGEIADNWGDYLRRKKKVNNTSFSVEDELFVSPFSNSKPSPQTNDFWWADPEHERFKNGLTEDLSANTPIAGVEPGKHPEGVRVILLLDGSVRVIHSEDDLWKKAYGENGMLSGE